MVHTHYVQKQFPLTNWTEQGLLGSTFRTELKDTEDQANAAANVRPSAATATN